MAPQGPLGTRYPRPLTGASASCGLSCSRRSSFCSFFLPASASLSFRDPFPTSFPGLLQGFLPLPPGS